MKIFLFSYAGSFGYAYRKWESVSSKKLELIPIDYPGKGTRINEEVVSSWKDLIADVTQEVTKHISNEEDYLMFGHSMGAKVAYDVCLKMQQTGTRLPKATFFSGTEPFNVKPSFYLEDDIVFKEKMIKLGGISKEVLTEPELAEFVFSNLRADAELINQFEFRNNLKLKTYPVIFSGTKDHLGSVEQWQSILGDELSWYEFVGEHFFIFDSAEKVINQIERFI